LPASAHSIVACFRQKGTHRFHADRTVGLIGACLLLGLALAGCALVPASPTPPPGEIPAPTPELVPTEAPVPGTTVVEFWEPFALDRPQGLLLGEMVRDFQVENPDVEVTLVPKSGYLGIHGAIQAELPDGNLPDLAVAFPSMIAQYSSAGVVVPLARWINDPELGLAPEGLADIFPGYLDAGRLPAFGQEMMGFPFVLHAIGMWVNDTLLSQAGWDHPPATWAEFEQACFDVYATTGVRCYPYIESVSTFNAWLYSRGGSQIDDMGFVATFNSPAAVESLALLRRLIDAGLAWRPDEPYGDYIAFADGQAAFTFSSTGNNLLYVEAIQAAKQRGVAPFKWHLAMIPQDQPGGPATAVYGASFFILQGDPSRQDAAWRLIRWFSDPLQTARWAAEMEATPVRASALAVMTDTLEAYPFLRREMTGILPFGRPEPAVAGELEVRDLLYTAILSVTQGFADPQIALDETARKADAILQP